MGCDVLSSEPTYGGMSVSGMNYTPFNLSRFIIRDKYGNRAGGGGDLMPGSGAGSVNCCYKLKGTEFTVDWEVYDADEAIKAIDAHQKIRKIHKTTQVHFPKTKISGGIGAVILGVHFYPDDHVEFEFRNDMGGSRIDYAAVDHWFQTKSGELANIKDPDEAEWFEARAFRRTARVASQGWLKYRLTDTTDLQQYVYYTLVVSPGFDKHPAVQRIVEETKGKLGAFGAAMEALPDSVVQEIRSNRFEHVTTGAEHG
ncbi:DUF3304 domain-containing protein [Paraburkholderia sp.]|uniref:DUF3304 domain-containing protein n=1 Tax=Paraburkholderia sp. TaxID=1926495 RepID=UPI0025D16276|nr:DUF3304 domain-containing protein [Paraburkholderia sp.]